MTDLLDCSLKSVIEQIHDSSKRFIFSIAGAGSSAISALTAIPGCTSTLIDCHIHYSCESTDEQLDYSPEKYVSSIVGRQLAQHAYAEAHLLGKSMPDSDELENVIGVGCTSSIKTNRDRLGFDQMFLSCWSRSFITSYELILPFDKTRSEQELTVGRMIIAAMADCCDIELGKDIKESWCICTSTKTVHSKRSVAIDAFLRSKVSYALFNRFGEVRMKLDPYASEYWKFDHKHYLLFPGSFYPIHVGHLELARVASHLVRKRKGHKPTVVTFEISAEIIDKSKIDPDNLEKRVTQFLELGSRIAVTKAKLFVEKARLFRNHGLILGVDTATRVIDPKYYGDNIEKMIDALKEIRSCGCYFIVGGRLLPNGTWEEWSNVAVPKEIQDMFITVPQSDFRVDISSTEIRARQSEDEVTLDFQSSMMIIE